jgi:hypothetical protein
VVKIKKFLQIRVIHIEKPTEYKISANLEKFLKTRFFTSRGRKNRIFKKFFKLKIYIQGVFGHGEHESEKIFDFDHWKLPLGEAYP